VKKQKKQVIFNYQESNGAISLGLLEDIIAEGNHLDKSCKLNFKTRMLSIGVEEEFSLCLLPRDVEQITLAIWKAYSQADPKQARENFPKIFSLIHHTI